MEIKTNIQKTEITTTTKSIEVGPHVYVCHETTKTVKVGNAKPSCKTREYVQSKVRGSKAKHFGSFHVVDPSLIERIQMKGWFVDREDFDLVIEEEPFTHVASGKPYEVVRLKDYDHTLYTVEGEHLPVAMHFHYIDGYVDNENFDLEKLAKHLENRDDVTLQYHLESTPIYTIPHYNRTSRRDTGISFIWHPDVETYRRYKKECGERDYFYAIAHKFMGNDAFLINK